MTSETLQGGCHCGDIRYEIDPSNAKTVICHCTGCQKQSASAFGLVLLMPSSQLTLIQGSPKQWTRTTDSGNIQDTFLCGTCGTRVWHGNPATEDTIKLRAGALDTPVDVSHAIHLWTRSKLPGVVIPEGARSFEQAPG